MARIPDHELERLKREVSLLQLVVGAGVELKLHYSKPQFSLYHYWAARGFRIKSKKQGQDFLGLCPFHEDREPSLVISPDKNLWHCFGACQAGGSVIDWVMRIEKVSFRHAVELLRGQVGWHPAASVFARSPSRGLESSGACKY